MATLDRPYAGHSRFPHPSWRTALLLLAVIGIIWAALAVQAAILSQRQDDQNAAVQQQIKTLTGQQIAPAAAFPMDVSDQAKTAPYNAALAPATTEPVKDIAITTNDSTMIGIAKGVNFKGWSFGNSIPARPIHVRQGDTVHFTLTNNSTMGHGVDFHAAEIDPGADYKVVLPGQSFSFDWVANRPGVFMFHCSSAPVIEHIANGMYGAIIVDPSTPLPAAREYVLVQGEYYLKPDGSAYVGDINKMLADTPDYVVFNGMANQYREHPLAANPGEPIRLYVVNAGPSETSAFHVIGALFDAVHPDGNPANTLVGVQTYNIPPGGAASFDLTIQNPGSYAFVTHDFADASKGAIGVIQVGAPAQAAAQPAAAQAAAAGQGIASATTAVVAKDNSFDQKQITVKAGQSVTIALTNSGTALHNVHVIGLKGSDGKDVQTALVEGGKSGSVSFTPTQPGTYKFQCDVHPADMSGTLIVQ
jgi:copper-containing nitrite reductase